jgi:hypothetical protein
LLLFQAAYIRCWCPEIAHLPTHYLLDPRKISAAVRKQYNLDETILPLPVVKLYMDLFPIKASSNFSNIPISNNSNTPSSSYSSSENADLARRRNRNPKHGFVPGR